MDAQQQEGALRLSGVHRKEPVTIRVNGEPIAAYRGESLLAALLVAGFRTLRHSHVQRQPRGALCGMGVCYECQVTVNGVPGVRACMTEVQDRMEVEVDEPGKA